MAPGKAKLNKREQLLKRIYYDPSKGGSYTGETGLLRAAIQQNKNKRIKIQKEDVRSFLESQDVHTLHKPVRKSIVRRRVFMGKPFTQWQVDLVDMRSFKKEGNVPGWILMCIDVFTKKAFSVPVLSKQNDDIIKGFQTIFNQLPQGQIPSKIQSDKGHEFLGQKVQNWVKARGIKWFTTQDDYTKASIVERLNRTIKGKMWKVFEAKDTKKWVDILPSIIDGYNETFHSTIKMTPNEAHTDDPEMVARVYNNTHYRSRLNRGLKREVLNPPTRGVNVDDPVRLNKTKGIFDKGYLPNYTDEIFKVKQKEGTLPQTYSTIDNESEPILGTFYPTEVQKVGTADKRKRYAVHPRR